PYLEPEKLFSKWSLIGGWKISGEMSYQRRELKEVIGINPVLGISYELSRYISVDFLGIFYKRKSVNPLNQSSNLGLAPCLTLSFDFDLINRVKFLFSNNPYSIEPTLTNLK